MNLKKIFEFLKEKRGYNYPVIYKLINGIPLTKDELNFKDTLDLENTKITSLPDNLTVGRSLNLINTPLSEKYSREQIRKMIEDKGGEIKYGQYLYKPKK
jgi:hypothetical protein